MNRPGYLEGVGVALAASLGASLSMPSLQLLLPGDAPARALITLIGLAYLLYLLARSGQRLGRTVALAAWGGVSLAAWWLAPSVTGVLLAQLGLLWLARSLYHYAAVLPALADLALLGLGLAVALWAATETHSLFLTVWCFFLVQAAFVAIPPRVGLRARRAAGNPAREDPFGQARHAAEAALRQLASRH